MSVNGVSLPIYNFDDLDLNHDGVLDESEIGPNSDFAKKFEKDMAAYIEQFSSNKKTISDGCTATQRFSNATQYLSKHLSNFFNPFELPGALKCGKNEIAELEKTGLTDFRTYSPHHYHEIPYRREENNEAFLTGNEY